MKYGNFFSLSGRVEAKHGPDLKIMLRACCGLAPKVIEQKNDLRSVLNHLINFL